jgi:hypothetical protein
VVYFFFPAPFCSLKERAGRIRENNEFQELWGRKGERIPQGEKPFLGFELPHSQCLEVKASYLGDPQPFS